MSIITGSFAFTTRLGPFAFHRLWPSPEAREAAARFLCKKVSSRSLACFFSMCSCCMASSSLFECVYTSWSDSEAVANQDMTARISTHWSMIRNIWKIEFREYALLCQGQTGQRGPVCNSDTMLLLPALAPLPAYCGGVLVRRALSCRVETEATQIIMQVSSVASLFSPQILVKTRKLR